MSVMHSACGWFLILLVAFFVLFGPAVGAIVWFFGGLFRLMGV